MGSAQQRKGCAAELELSRILQRHGYNVEPGRAMRFSEYSRQKPAEPAEEGSDKP